MDTTSRRIVGERLDTVLERLKPPTMEVVTETEAATAAEEFEATLRTRAGRPGYGAAASLHEDVIDFIMPRVTEPGIFQTNRFLSILEHLVSVVFPSLPESEELRTLATAVIADEIARQRELIERRHDGIAA